MKRKSSTGIPKMIPNPAYFSDEVVQMRLGQYKDTLAHFGECPEDYFPADYDKELPEEGGWVMMLMAVHVGRSVGEKTESITVPHLSIWYATPTKTKYGRSFEGISIPLTQAIIRTPQGEVHVWPHEYKRINIADFLEFGESDGFYIRFLHPETGGFDEQKLFYLRTRGLSKTVAQRILLPELNNPNFCYFEFDPAYSDVFSEGTGTPYFMPHNHKRRAAAQERKREV